MRCALLLLFAFFGVCDLAGQTLPPSWHYLRSGNTGVAGEEHAFLQSDPLGNLWTCGRNAFMVSEGGLVRVDPGEEVFRCWSNVDGYLPSSMVYGAAVDGSGEVWVASAGGLTRGTNGAWTTYNAGNSPLPSSHLRGVALGPDGKVWMVFQEVNLNVGGLASFDGANWEIYTPANSDLPDHTCRKLLVGEDGTVWVATDLAVSRLQNGVWSTYDWNNSTIAGWGITDIALDEVGRLHVVTGGWAWSDEVAVFDGNNWSTVGPEEAPWLTGCTVLDLYFRAGRAIYTVSGSQGLGAVLVETDGSWSFHPSGDILFDVHIDHEGTFWTAGISSVSHFVDGSWRDYTRYSAGLSEDFNQNILIDSQQRLWVANGNGGAHVFDCPRWESYGPYNQGLFPSPQSLSTVGSTVCEDSAGNLWFAYNSTSGTVVRIPGGNYSDYGSWEVFDGTNSPVSWVTESVADGWGNVFFYSDYGTHMYAGSTGTWTTWDLTNSPLQYYTYGFGTDPAGRAHFGGFQQIAVYDATAVGNEWSVWNLAEAGAAGISVVNDIAFTEDGAILLATPEGLWRHLDGNWTQWTPANANLMALNVFGVEVGNDGTLYACGYDVDGFLNGGISRLLPGAATWETWTTENSSLPAEQIDDIAPDAAGNLWINAYPRGIAIFRPGGLVGLDCLHTTLDTWETNAVPNLPPAALGAMSAFPNPTLGPLALQLPQPLAVAGQLTIMGLAGQTLHQSTWPAGLRTFELPQHLPPGSWQCLLEVPGATGLQRFHCQVVATPHGR